jgi:hypothetical protein
MADGQTTRETPCQNQESNDSKSQTTLPAVEGVRTCTRDQNSGGHEDSIERGMPQNQESNEGDTRVSSDTTLPRGETGAPLGTEDQQTGCDQESQNERGALPSEESEGKGVGDNEILSKKQKDGRRPVVPAQPSGQDQSQILTEKAIEQHAHKSLLPVVEAPPEEEVSKAKDVIRRYTHTNEDPKINVFDMNLNSFVATESAVQDLLKEVTSMSEVDQNAIQELKGILDLVQYCDRTTEESQLRVDAENEFAWVKTTVVSRPSETSARAHDIAIRFAVARFKNPDQPSGFLRVRKWFARPWSSGSNLEVEFKKAVDTLLRAELANNVIAKTL